MHSTDEIAGAKEGSTLVLFPRHGKTIKPVDASPRNLRIALYSHDTMGLGHMRRNLLIAQRLSAHPLDASVLMIAGASQISRFQLPSGVDCLTLPALSKREDGQYQSRRLDVPLKEIIKLRARAILAAVEAFEPDLMIVDNVPRGAARELDPALEYLRHHGRTRVVLGLRDVLDSPDVVRCEWDRARNMEAIRDYYDAVWVYGDPAVYDLAREYDFPFDVRARIRYAGYLDQSIRLASLAEADEGLQAPADLPEGRLALCAVGGGQDGNKLAETFARAELPEQFCGVILTGPYMPAAAQQRLRDAVRERPRFRVLEFVKEPLELLKRADRVVAMGGYNTTSEVLSLGKRALIVPRVAPRREQLIRARNLKRLGLVDLLEPDKLNEHALTEWLGSEEKAPPLARSLIGMNGLDQLPSLVEEALSTRGHRAEGEFKHAAF